MSSEDSMRGHQTRRRIEDVVKRGLDLTEGLDLQEVNLEAARFKDFPPLDVSGYDLLRVLQRATREDTGEFSSRVGLTILNNTNEPLYAVMVRVWTATPGISPTHIRVRREPVPHGVPAIDRHGPMPMTDEMFVWEARDEAGIVFVLIPFYHVLPGAPRHVEVFGASSSPRFVAQVRRVMESESSPSPECGFWGKRGSGEVSTDGTHIDRLPSRTPYVGRSVIPQFLVFLFPYISGNEQTKNAKTR